MTQHQIFACAIVLFVLLGAAVLVYYLRLKHTERIELIKKGDYAFEGNYLENLKYGVLSKSILLISLALGFGIGYAITRNMNDSSLVVIYLISLLGTAGAGLLSYYFILKNKVK